MVAEPALRRLFVELTDHVRDGGGFVSPALEWSLATGSGSPGLTSADRAPAGTLLLRVPQALQLSYTAARELAPSVASAGNSASAGAHLQSPELVAFVAAGLAQSLDVGLLPAWLPAWLETLGLTDLGVPIAWLGSEEAASEARRFDPSPEVEVADRRRRDLASAHASLVQSDPVSFGNVTFEHLLRAARAVESREFDINRAPRLVPVADMFNHSSSPNAAWAFAEGGALEVQTLRPLVPGDEVTISYGADKSNARLLRAYGFTVEPAVEPCYSLRAFPCRLREVHSEHPALGRSKLVDLDTSRVDKSLKLLIKRCVARAVDPAVLLEGICRHLAAPYERDPCLVPCLRLLQAVRAVDPRRLDWWSISASSCANQSDGASSADCRDALRVKMSEYLCLVVHLQALDLHRGVVAKDQCSELAVVVHRRLEHCWSRARREFLKAQGKQP